MRKLPALLVIACLGLGCAAQTGAAAGAGAPRSAALPTAVSFGGWMLRETGGYADWLGVRYRGRFLREPINVVIVDPFAKSAEEAIQRVMRETKVAGYEEEYGHSAGYCAEMDGAPYRQIPNDKKMAFSNRDFLRLNNHGRIMGPLLVDGLYVFAAAFSTERPSPMRGFEHVFVSFNRARNDFCAKMNALSIYKSAGSLDLGNAIADPDLTTGDHDGKALILVAAK